MAVPLADYNTGYSSGINHGTTYSSTLAGGGTSPHAINMGMIGGNANVSVAVLVAVALAVMLIFHVLGFRFAFDVSVGR